MSRSLSRMAFLAMLSIGSALLAESAWAQMDTNTGIAQPPGRTLVPEAYNYRNWIAPEGQRPPPQRWDPPQRAAPVPPRWQGYRYRPRVYVDRYVPVYPPDFYNYGDYGRPHYRAAPRRTHIGLSRAHVEWCRSRYKTYRASDNTYKPTRNTRHQCVSPYS